MKKLNLFAAMLLMVAGLQSTWGQGFRVYQSDGTELQFSLKTDSIVFDNGLNGDEVFGPFTPVNLCIARTWYKSKSETVTFGEDGKTDYMEGATYKFFPYQGNIVFFNVSGTPINILKVYEVTAEKMIVSSPDGSSLGVWSSTKPSQLVTSIVLSETSIALQPDESKRLTAIVLPADADNPAVTWSSSNDAVAEVNSSGRVIANANGTCTIICSATDGSGVKAECQVTVTSGTDPDPEGHEWVDLGLPSGTLWATCNVGAEKPEDYGDYFAWGETSGFKDGKTNFAWSTYKYCNGSYNTITKYCTSSIYGTVDNKTELESADDAATANWGVNWQMPSLEQCAELIDGNNTTTSWTTLNGVSGRMIVSKSNGNKIFLPAAGDRNDTSLYYVGSYGYYWSRSLCTSSSDSAYYLFSYSSSIYYTGIYTDYYSRFYGLSVRPVRVQE